MKTTTAILSLLFSAITSFTLGDTFGSGPNTFNIDFVTIGNPGNAIDTTGNPGPVIGAVGAGSVPYVFRMGTYEVSRDMIAKANAPIALGGGGLGITLGFLPPLNSNLETRPATYVSWFEAAKFVNWLNTSQGYHAAYKFDGLGNFQLWTASDPGYNANNLYRNSLANFVLPSCDEWYKSAYYDSTANSGLGGYWDFPTGSDATPTAVESGTGAGTAVYGFNEGHGPAEITAAGGLSPFGTMGQAGDAQEWEETAFDLTNNSINEFRGVRGGSWADTSNVLVSRGRLGGHPAQESNEFLGFRVASTYVPEPSTLLLAFTEFATLLTIRRKSVPHNRV